MRWPSDSRSCAARVPAIHDRHVQVEHHQIRAVFTQLDDGLLSMAGLHHIVAVTQQQIGGQLPQIDFVVHHENQRGDAIGRTLRLGSIRYCFAPPFGQEDVGELNANVVDETWAKVVDAERRRLCPLVADRFELALRVISGCDDALNRRKRATRLAGGPRKDVPEV